MTILQVQHTVRDFDTWKESFDSDPVGREAGGVRRYRVLRATDDPNHVVIELEFDGSDQADAFAGKLRELWAGLPNTMGLLGAQARVLDEVETKEY